MSLPYISKTSLRKPGNIFLLLLILLGILLRLVIYFQNRDLIIDEANIVRNLSERGFLALLQPLDYEQYAPVLFIWIEELASLLFGYGPFGLKLFPLLSGIASMFLLYRILRQLGMKYMIWLPVGLFALNPYLIEYAATIKQYMSDVLVTLLLIYLALKTDLAKITPGRFYACWVPAGMIAILASMPSVFLLAAVASYYCYYSFTSGNRKFLLPIFITGFSWLLLFGVYYWFILRQQIGSDYLQDYHANYFLHLLPRNKAELLHNIHLVDELICHTSGYSFVNHTLALIFLFVGCFQLLRRKLAIALLILLPLLLVLLASALHQFTLIIRVSLFTFPLFLILLGLGAEEIFNRARNLLCLLPVVAGCLMLMSHNKVNLLWKFHGFHEITHGLRYLKEKNVPGDRLYIHHASTPTYIYYTEIHPGKEEYRSLLGAHLTQWNTGYATATQEIKDTIYLLVTGGFPDEEKARVLDAISTNMDQIDYFESYICFVYGFAPKRQHPAASSEEVNQGED